MVVGFLSVMEDIPSVELLDMSIISVCLDRGMRTGSSVTLLEMVLGWLSGHCRHHPMAVSIQQHNRNAISAFQSFVTTL